MHPKKGQPRDDNDGGRGSEKDGSGDRLGQRGRRTHEMMAGKVVSRPVMTAAKKPLIFCEAEGEGDSNSMASGALRREGVMSRSVFCWKK